MIVFDGGTLTPDDLVGIVGAAPSCGSEMCMNSIWATTVEVTIGAEAGELTCLGLTPAFGQPNRDTGLEQRAMVARGGFVLQGASSDRTG